MAADAGDLATPAAPSSSGPLATPRWVRVVCAAPELIAAAVAGFGLPLMIMLLAGHLDWPLAYPVGVIGAVAAVLACGATGDFADRDVASWTLAAAGILLAWFVVNLFFSGQDLYAHRDPTTYLLAGRWLMDHHSLQIHTDPAFFGPAQTFPGWTDQSAGYTDLSHGVLVAQANHLLPVLLAAIGKIVGVDGLFRINIAFGAAALFAFFGMARRYVGPRWALLAMSALAVSIPMLYVSRDDFTEPLALLFLAAGLTLLHRATTTGETSAYAMTGLVAGMSSLVRVDSYAAMLSIALVAVILVARAVPGARRDALRRNGAMLLAALVPTVLGYLDVTRLSPSYYTTQRHDVVGLAGLGFVIVLGGVLLVYGVWQRGWFTRLRSDAARVRLARWMAYLIVAVFLVLASRPLWLVGMGPDTPYLATVQAAAGDAISPHRTYNELTVSWQAWYFGWVSVVLAVAGYVLLVRRLLVRRDWPLLGVLVMGLSISMLYLLTSQITPDQVWASRRYVPVVMPMLLVAAVYALRAARTWTPSRAGVWWHRGIAAASALVVVYPLAVTVPVFDVREEVPQLSMIRAICDTVRGGALVGVDYNSVYSYQQSIRAFCGVPITGLQGATPDQLAEIEASVAAHGTKLYIMSTDPTAIFYAPGLTPSQPFKTVRTTRWPSTLHTTPTAPSHETISVYLATVDADGFAVPVN